MQGTIARNKLQRALAILLLAALALLCLPMDAHAACPVCGDAVVVELTVNADSDTTITGGGVLPSLW